MPHVHHHSKSKLSPKRLPRSKLNRFDYEKWRYIPLEKTLQIKKGKRFVTIRNVPNVAHRLILNVHQKIQKSPSKYSIAVILHTCILQHRSYHQA